MDFQDYSRRAMSAIENYEWHAALISLQKLMILDPESENWRLLYIKAAIKSHKYSQAEEVLEECNGDEVWYLKYKTKNLVRQGKFKRALACCPDNMKNKVELEVMQYELGTDTQVFKAFRKWLKLNGCQISLTKVRNFEQKFRGVCAATYLPPYTKIVFIPDSLILYPEQCYSVLPPTTVIPFKSYHSIYAFFLAVESKNPKSFWAPYLNILPKDFSNFPVFFDNREIQILRGSSLLKMLEIQRQENVEDFSMVAETGLCTFEEFLKGKLLVSSRLHSIPAQNDLSGLVPFADMFNHRRLSKISWSYDFDNKGFYIETANTSNRGEEIFIDYGSKSNIKLMLAYGFALEENEDDEFVMFLKLNKADELKDLKQELIRKVLFFHLTMKTDSKYFQDLLGFLRLKFCQDSEFIKKNQEKFYNLKNIQFVTIENEVKVIDYLQTKCEKYLSEFGEFEGDLKESQGNMRNCWLVREGEIRVLKWGIRFCKDIKRIFCGEDQGPADLSYQAYLSKLKGYIQF